MLLWTDASGFVVWTQLIAYDSFKVEAAQQSLTDSPAVEFPRLQTQAPPMELKEGGCTGAWDISWDGPTCP